MKIWILARTHVHIYAFLLLAIAMRTPSRVRTTRSLPLQFHYLALGVLPGALVCPAVDTPAAEAPDRDPKRSIFNFASA